MHWTGESAVAGADAPESTSDLNSTLQAWSGASDRQWAYVAACPRDEFDSLATRLKSAGYAPLTIRPYVAQSQGLVAVAFDRSHATAAGNSTFPPAGRPRPLSPRRPTAGRYAIWPLMLPASEGQADRFVLLFERAGNNKGDSRFLIDAHLPQFQALKAQ